MNSPNELIRLLSTHHINFVIVGGFAAVLHGSTQVTHDLDLCLALDPKQIENLRKILNPYKPVHRMTPNKLSFENNPVDISKIKNLYLDTTLGQIDLLTEIIGVGDFETVLKNAVTVTLFEYSCKVLNVDSLIASKTSMARPKDLAVIKELKIISDRKLKPSP